MHPRGEPGDEELRMLVERVADYAIFMLDATGHITSWNPAAERMKGYTAQEIIGKHFSILYLDEDVKAGVPERNLQRAAEEGTYRGEGRRLRKNGDVFEADVEITKLGDESTMGPGFAKIVRDVSDRARDQARLRQVNVDLGEFSSIAAHDLQEPLRQMRSYLALHVQRSGASFDDQSKGYVRRAIESADRMDRLITYLLALARIGAEEAPTQPVDMESAWQEAVDVLGDRIRELDASVTMEALPSALGHREHLVRLFTDLLSNALKYQREGVKPLVHASAAESPNGRMLVFSVRDNGLGIAPEDTPRIFAAFQRLQTRQEYPGAGLGLALCRKIVEHHHGRIWVDSEVGRGSTFSFTLKKP